MERESRSKFHGARDRGGPPDMVPESMFFPYLRRSAVAETSKNMKYAPGNAGPMEGCAAVPTLERLSTGGACDELGCFEEGVWLVAFNGDSARLSSKHTKSRMRDSARWAEAFAKVVE